MSHLTVTDVVFTPAGPAAQRTGLLGYVRCRFAGALVLDGLTLRVTENGLRTLSFPSRTDGQGRKHPLYRPVDDATRRQLKDAILSALGISIEGAPDGSPFETRHPTLATHPAQPTDAADQISESEHTAPDLGQLTRRELLKLRRRERRHQASTDEPAGIPCIRHEVQDAVLPTPRTTVEPRQAAPLSTRITLEVSEVDPFEKRPPPTPLQQERPEPSPARRRRSIQTLRLLRDGEQPPSDSTEERR